MKKVLLILSFLAVLAQSSLYPVIERNIDLNMILTIITAKSNKVWLLVDADIFTNDNPDIQSDLAAVMNTFKDSTTFPNEVNIVAITNQVITPTDIAVQLSVIGTELNIPHYHIADLSVGTLHQGIFLITDRERGYSSDSNDSDQGQPANGSRKNGYIEAIKSLINDMYSKMTTNYTEMESFPSIVFLTRSTVANLVSLDRYVTKITPDEIPEGRDFTCFQWTKGLAEV